MRNAGEEAAQAQHEAVSPFIATALSELLAHPAVQAHMQQQPPTIAANSDADADPIDFVDALAVFEAEHGTPLIRPALVLVNDREPLEEVLNRPVSNAGAVRVLSIERALFVVPARAQFLMCDMLHLPRLLPRRTFDVVVIDPPWENKSVRRSGRYGTVPTHRLRQLPVPAMCHPTTLVFVWCTNRHRHMADLTVCMHISARG